MAPNQLLVNSSPKLKLPDKRDSRDSLTCKIALVTPIYGGGVKAGVSDDCEPIRAATVRGHLRFWWRELYGHGLSNRDLLQEETKIWGGTKYKDPNDKKEKSLQSLVETHIRIENKGRTERADKRFKYHYALFPTRQPNGQFDRIRTGVTFELRLVYPKSNNDQFHGQILNTLKAWVLFGGYGSRTRRGVGCLNVIELKLNDKTIPLNKFLPEKLDQNDLPKLPGVKILFGQIQNDAETAWQSAVGWLSDFRQGLGVARHGTQQRPGITDWPEPDKMRRLCQYPGGYTSWQHSARPTIGSNPAWPRASFGLPIITKFQHKGKTEYPNPEPGFQRRTRQDGSQYWKPQQLELQWVEPAQNPNNAKKHERLGSPLIVKAVPLANGKFVPCALWLNRSYPSGKVVLVDKSRPAGYQRVNNSEADFDVIQAPGDGPPIFAPLNKTSVLSAPQGKRIQTAFFEWVKATKPGIQEVTL